VCKVANAIHAAHLAQRIRRALARPIQVGAQQLSVTASVGIAVSTPATADADRLLRSPTTACTREAQLAPGRRRNSNWVVDQQPVASDRQRLLQFLPQLRVSSRSTCMAAPPPRHRRSRGPLGRSDDARMEPSAMGLTISTRLLS